MEETQEREIPDSDVEVNAEATGRSASAGNGPMEKKLKRELQCPVCDKIPTSLPIQTCSKGHILCTDCKNKIPFNGGRQPCPICRSPLPYGHDDSNSHVVGSLISLLSDIPCSFKDSGCSFEGSIEDHKAHRYACKFRLVVQCGHCLEECMIKDFVAHNSRNCFLTSPTNTFNFPGRNSLYLIEVDTEEGLLEVLVEASYVNNARLRKDDNGIDYVGFNFFPLGSSGTTTSSIKMKIVMKSPDDPIF